jgi:chorismate-pyruvate lyase
MIHDSRDSSAPLNGAQAALMNLCRPFAPAQFAPQYQVVAPSEMAPAASALLVHENHMTLQLQQHYGKLLDVHVLEEHRQADYYTRKVSLTLAATPRIVEWGIARMNLSRLPAPIQSEILSRQSPLGAILHRHQTRRRIVPRYYVRFSPDSAVLKLFGGDFPDQPLFGRLATIYVDEQPAVDLLEIIAITEPTES